MSDLTDRLRRGALEHLAGRAGVETRGRPEAWGTRGRCPGTHCPTVPLRFDPDVFSGSSLRSQCSTCDWVTGQPVGDVLHGHDRVWRDERGALAGYLED